MICQIKATFLEPLACDALENLTWTALVDLTVNVSAAGRTPPVDHEIPFQWPYFLLEDAYFDLDALGILQSVKRKTKDIKQLLRT